MLLSEVEQDNKYIVIKLSNNDKKYKIVSFSNNSRLFKDQKMSLLMIVNKFYSEIWLMKKEYLSEL